MGVFALLNCNSCGTYMSRLVLWGLYSLLSILQVSVLAELNYHGPGRGAPSIFTNTGAESELGENAIADPWDNHPQYGFGDNFLDDSRGEAADGANSLQLNIAKVPPSDHVQRPESLWLSESLDCHPTKNLIPNNKRRARRQSDRICPFPTNNMNNQLAPGAEAGTQPAPLLIPPPVLRQDRKPTNMILEEDPAQENDWVCNHPTSKYPVCAAYEHATEMPLGSGSYQLLMAKLCEYPFSRHFSTIISFFRTGNWHYPLSRWNRSLAPCCRTESCSFVFRLTYFADDPGNCEAPDILWCCAEVEKVSYPPPLFKSSSTRTDLTKNSIA